MRSNSQDDMRAEVGEVDLRGYGQARGGGAAARGRADRPAVRPRDRSAATGRAARLARMTRVLLSMHHMVSDRWSMGVLMKELTRCYVALVTGTPDGLPELPVQYGDFAACSRSRRRNSVGARHCLLDQTAERRASRDRPGRRPAQAQGEELPRVVGAVRIMPALVTRLRELGRTEGATLFMVLAAVFKFFSPLSGTDDIVVGTPVANRTLPELEPLIGLFVNTLALRCD